MFAPLLTRRFTISKHPLKKIIKINDYTVIELCDFFLDFLIIIREKIMEVLLINN